MILSNCSKKKKKKKKPKIQTANQEYGYLAKPSIKTKER
jgi:hypothetical protein